jgi:hypothetical protein
VNELLGTRLARRLGLPTVPVEVVEVSPELIRLTPELAMEMPRGRVPCQAGLQFGSRYPGDPRRATLHDFLPDEQLREVQNLHEFTTRCCGCSNNCIAGAAGYGTLILDAKRSNRQPFPNWI